MKTSAVVLMCSIGFYVAAEPLPVPRFTDSARREKLAKAFSETDAILERYMKQRGAPGLVYGIVIDGELAHVKAFGVRDRSSKDPVMPSTVFRIASMTKSFTALAILKLRDEGKLSLDDPVSKWIPEIARLPLPTRDTAPLRVRQLLTHGAGFPEDNPWGDQQLGIPDDTLTAWLKEGIPFSTAPDTAYEYSNYGFALAGRVVASASKRPYRDYVEKEILAPLGMRSSSLEPSAVPERLRATGYRRTGEGQYSVEPSLPHGAFGAMGGMLTSAEDLAKYVGFHLSAWPPRDDEDPGPVRRSSVREMQRAWRTSDFRVARTPAGDVQGAAGGYGYGLGSRQDCRFAHIVSHGGGLPGFGSFMMWLPDYGVGLFAMTNLTYAGPSSALSEALDALAKTGGLAPRELPPSPVLTRTRDALVQLWNSWDEGLATKIAADNLFKDSSLEARRRQIANVRQQVGDCKAPTEVEAENWLRGTFYLPCANGRVRVHFTLAPTARPRVQHLQFERVTPGSEPKRATCQ